MDKRTRRTLLSGAANTGSTTSASAARDHESAAAVGPARWARQDTSVARAVLDLGASDEVNERWVPQPNVIKKQGVESQANVAAFAAGLGIFFSALLPRLYCLYFLTDPENPGLGWFNDTLHHWQIAYLSNEIGFSKGFLTLWDFKGMEYFWGLLHPLVLAMLFRVSGSVDIIIPRLLSAFASSVSYALIFVLLRRYFNTHVAVGATLLAVANPVAIFGDTAGMQEPLGVVLLMTALVLWPRKSFWGGILAGLAGMVRAEYWVFGAGLLVASWLTRENGERKITLAIGWAVPSLLYMRYMLAKTGNAIYPVYWNYFGTVAGQWMPDRSPTSLESLTQWAARLVFALAVLGGIWLVRRRPRGMLFLGMGLANILLLGFMWGFSDYVLGFETRILIGRLVIVPYIYTGIFITVLLLHFLPAKLEAGRRRTAGQIFGWSVVLALAVGIQLAWKPVLNYYNERADLWTSQKLAARQVASYYDGGTIVIPSGLPGLTYTLVRFEGIPGQALQSSMYDPFFYMKTGDPFEDWESNRQEIAAWIDKLDIRLLTFDRGNRTYQEMVSREPDWFRQLAPGADGHLEIYRVTPP